MKSSQLNYLSAMGIQSWQLRQSATSSDNQSTENLTTLCATVANCTACALHKTRTQTVFGVGNSQAELMLIGEAPGFYEDQKGEPFVGRAGQLLNAMLDAIGFDRRTVYIANVLKCRPPNNRDPSPEEVSQCTGFLTQQIALVQPKLLLALGRIAAHYLLNTQASLGQMRGKLHSYGMHAIPLIITYHPAYLLRNPRDKNKAWQDLQWVYDFLNQSSGKNKCH
jgi:uracil-DNA glycosylase family 4